MLHSMRHGKAMVRASDSRVAIKSSHVQLLTIPLHEASCHTCPSVVEFGTSYWYWYWPKNCDALQLGQ